MPFSKCGLWRWYSKGSGAHFCRHWETLIYIYRHECVVTLENILYQISFSSWRSCTDHTTKGNRWQLCSTQQSSMVAAGEAADRNLEMNLYPVCSFAFVYPKTKTLETGQNNAFWWLISCLLCKYLLSTFHMLDRNRPKPQTVTLLKQTL